MKIPKHTHPKDFWWWLRLASYVVVTICFALGPDVVPKPVMWALVYFSIWKFFLWAKSFFACFHCLIRFVLAASVAVILYLNVPYQYYLAAILVTWLDYFMRFGHTFVKEDHYTIQKLIESQK